MLFSFFEKRTGLFERLSKCVLFLSCVVRCAARSTVTATLFFFFFLTLFRVLFSFWTSRGHGGVVPSSPRFLPSIFVAHRVHQSHCSSIFHRVLLTHALALSASQYVHKKKSQRIYTSMHSAGVEPTKLTYNYCGLSQALG